MFAKVFVRLGEDFKLWRETGDAIRLFVGFSGHWKQYESYVRQTTFTQLLFLIRTSMLEQYVGFGVTPRLNINKTCD